MENVELFRLIRKRHSFGTRGSQVQILPLRLTRPVVYNGAARLKSE
jgi:hypothetical protein